MASGGQVDKVQQEGQRLLHRGLEDIGDGPFRAVGGKVDLENMGPVTAAVAFRAANEDITEELHLDLFEARAAAAFALTDTGVETEGAGVETALARPVALGEEIPDMVESAQVNGRVGAGRFAEGRLVHEDDLAERFPAGEVAAEI